MLRPGVEVGGYVVRSAADEGELSAVYEVEHTVLRTLHALKILTTDRDHAYARSIHHGAMLQAMVDHPHVVRCTDAGDHEGRPWLVTDWVNGGSLGSLLDARGALSVGLALRTLRSVARGLNAVHQASVVHRDLTTQNVLFSVSNGRRVAKITDFGLGKWLDATPLPDAPSSTLSLEFRTIGTPEYMAPEQAADPGAVDGRADLYSLGVVLYEMLTNEVPYEAEDTWRILVLARQGSYRPASALRPEVPPEVDALIADLLRPSPDDRLRSCEVLLDRLDGLVPRHE